MANPVPTKGFLQPSIEAAMLSQANVETCPLSPALPFLLVQKCLANVYQYRKKAHSIPTKAFVQLNPYTAILFSPFE